MTDSEQGWYWTPQWQAGEREATEQIATGQTTVYDDAEALFADIARD